ncbi:MAG: hypothetical protein HYR70_04180 [Chloroflexi bacterium]|nr:hypothetical protein [Chloroflexota bacterium]MBI3340754.1 hypothetical protein [Chloroflexota bacterium]
MIIVSITINADSAEFLCAALEKLARKLQDRDPSDPDNRSLTAVTEHAIATMTWSEEE